ncbi:probable mediator of RNA polymerase II transcription subunit 26b isoform X1 [Salvia splendens]|uniref:probable mediator of RNA polymerase II transcription subunit 26b isoform X1 n=1 Tax=Salvia splendens TaxID=180675 RepID=UPI001C27E60B|nr:probable mediator of RNA polymerase II transcription subunit 26b isoform X1 [Salvia splendens]
MGDVSLDKWRDYFRSASSDIFSIIEHAILIAASDCPHDFRLKRDRIAEMLFTCKLVKCFGCELNGDKSEDKLKSEIDDTKESKVNSSSRDYADDHTNQAEALTDEIEEESQFYGEVLRIKDVVDNFEDESDAMLFECLRKLQLMPLSVEILKATEIGKSVNSLRKHGSKEIRNIVRTLIEDWKVMVDSWVNATAAVAEMATESVKTSVVEEEEEEEGLPSPPLDEGAFFATPSSMELSQFFDGIDDDGSEFLPYVYSAAVYSLGVCHSVLSRISHYKKNKDGLFLIEEDVVSDPRNSGEFNKNRESGRKPTIPKTDHRKWKPQNPRDSGPPPNDRKPEPKRNEEATWMKQAPSKPRRPSSDEPGPGRPKPPSTESALGRFKPSPKPKVEYETIKAKQKSENRPIQRKPMPPQQEKVNLKNEASVRMKLEAAKRKLQERYQEAENAKKQRTIQVVELQDLPKQSQQRNPHMRAGNHNRQWTNGRR